jgi:hypothetical protein
LTSLSICILASFDIRRGLLSTSNQQAHPSGRVLGLVRKLIDYGRQLSAALLQRTTDLASVTCDFGTPRTSR